MGARVLLVAWKGSSATAWVGALTAGGYTVLLEDTTGERAWRTAKERGIDVVIIDGQKKPSHGRQTGYALRDTAKTRDIPIIWTNLDQEDGAAVETEVHPDVTLPAPTGVDGALSALQKLGERIHWANGALFDGDDGPDVARPTNGVLNGHSPVVTEAVEVEVEVRSEVTIIESAPVVEAPLREATRRSPPAKLATKPRKAIARPASRKKVSAKPTAAKSARVKPKGRPAPKKGARAKVKARRK